MNGNATSNHSLKIKMVFTGLGDTTVYDVSDIMSNFTVSTEGSIEEYNVFKTLMTRGIMTAKTGSAEFSAVATNGDIYQNFKKIANSVNPAHHNVDLYVTESFDGDTESLKTDFYERAIINITTLLGEAAGIRMVEGSFNLFANNDWKEIDTADVPNIVTPTITAFTVVDAGSGSVDFDWTINNPSGQTISSIEIREVGTSAAIEILAGTATSHTESSVTAGTYEYFINVIVGNKVISSEILTVTVA